MVVILPDCRDMVVQQKDNVSSLAALFGMTGLHLKWKVGVSKGEDSGPYLIFTKTFCKTKHEDIGQNRQNPLVASRDD